MTQREKDAALFRNAMGITAIEAERDALRAACEFALEHVRELREAWRTGALDERDGGGGTRSNRNVDVEVALRNALEDKRRIVSGPADTMPE